MSNQSNSNKHLHTAFKLKEVIDIFSRIDGQIVDLHKCSSDDFLGLNSDFKNYFKQSKVISDNASEIFQALSDPQSRELFLSLENLYRDLKTSQNSFSSQLEYSITLVQEIDALIDALFLPLKNLNQDLMSLKLLSANIKMSSTTNVQGKGANTEDYLLQLNVVINEFKACSLKNEKNLSGLKEQVKTILDLFLHIRNRNISDLDSILNHIHYGIILFAEKHEEASIQIPKLASKTENTAGSVADIVTNLQFHDIIRQKMEHIHDTQRNLLEELKGMAAVDQQSTLESESLVIRICDIAGLQSAQLIKANKEYQQAIEKITQRFLALGDDMSTIASMCKSFSVSNDNSEELQLQRALVKLESSAEVLSNFLQAGTDFTSSLKQLIETIGSTSQGVSGLKASIQKLKIATGDTVESISTAQTGDDSLKQSLSQFQLLFDDIEKFEQTIQNVFNRIQAIGTKLAQNAGDYDSTLQQKGALAQVSERMNAIILTLDKKNSRNQFLLEENLKISQAISHDVRESVKKVKYYDFFEKVIVDIISELNQVHQKLKTEHDANDENRAENLDNIKKRYTMASEHEIHDKLVSSEGDIDLFGDDEPKAEADDDNVEFF
jgi:LysM repeat protein